MSPLDENPGEHVFEPVFVARQPIVDGESRVYGYELLFRSGVSETTARMADADTATSKVLADGLPLALEIMLEPKKLFINFTQELLRKKSPLALPSEICVVEILEDVAPDPEVLAACRDIKNAGYLIAVDDFVGQPELAPFVDMADIVKVDVLGQPAARIAALAGPPLSRGISLLAEKVEDKATYDTAREAGFRYFQGYYFSRPEVVSGRKPPIGVVSRVRLLRELAHPDNDGDRLEAILSSDPGLSFRLLKYLNSAAFFRLDKITSLSHAMMVMGQNPLRKWLMAVVLSDMAHTPLGREISFQSLTRARFLELLSGYPGRMSHSPDSMFMLGLFSRMDALMGQSMAEVAARLPLDGDLLAALRGQPSQPGKMLALLTDLEHGNWNTALPIFADMKIDPADAARQYAASLAWAKDILG
ncbi:MAG: HDOD domain-containing protein [Desulfovibrio sp.]|nr:HDOD domain-containing protein [Desulfovibrio sp.]